MKDQDGSAESSGDHNRDDEELLKDQDRSAEPSQLKGSTTHQLPNPKQKARPDVVLVLLLSSSGLHPNLPEPLKT